MARISVVLLFGSALALHACGVVRKPAEGSGHGSGSSGGEPLAILFEEVRGDLVKYVPEIKASSLDQLDNRTVATWIQTNQAALVEEIRDSRVVWIRNQVECGRTARTPKPDIQLSIESCAAQNITYGYAAKILVHEAVHHFGIVEESFANQVAIAVNDLVNQAKAPTGEPPPAPEGDTQGSVPLHPPISVSCEVTIDEMRNGDGEIVSGPSFCWSRNYRPKVEMSMDETQNLIADFASACPTESADQHHAAHFDSHAVRGAECLPNQLSDYSHRCDVTRHTETVDFDSNNLYNDQVLSSIDLQKGHDSCIGEGGIWSPI